MSKPIPTVIASSTLRIMGVDLTVHVLDNGQRVIDTDSLDQFFAAMGDGRPLTEDDAVAAAKLIKGVS